MTDTADAQAEYARRLERWRADEARSARLARRLSHGRLAVFAVGIALFIWVVRERPDGLPWVGALAASFVGLVVWHGRVSERARRATRATALYERGLARLDDRWAGTGPTGAERVGADHVYARDLDLFGEGSVFQLLCTTRTRLGEERLAHWLAAPSDAADVRARQAAVRELTHAVDLREEIALLGDEVREELDPEVLEEWSGRPAEPLSMAIRAGALLLGLLGAASLAGWLVWDTGLAPVGLVALVQLLFTGLHHGRTRTLANDAQAAGAELETLSGLLRLMESWPAECDELRRLAAALGDDGRRASREVEQLTRALQSLENTERNPYFAPVAFLLQLRVHKIHAVELWRVRFGGAVAGWLEAARDFEALAALAAYAYEHPDDVFPEVVERAPMLEAEDIGHPLLPVAGCVRNDLRLDEDLRLVLISGSNMSGKSTLLRTIGVSTVLAMAGAPVRARRLVVSPFAIGASIQIQDSLREGTSHFYAEIKRLQAIDDLTRGDRPVLFLLDEILHGTNSSDRLVGADAVVRKLVERGAVGLVTTHDLALTHIAEELGGRARNAHFSDTVEDGRMVFDYRMREGVVQRGNALDLMRSLGLEV